jgi:ribokinase
MGDNFDVVVVGSLHLDIVVKGPRLPALDETVMGKAWSFKCGGKGGNQAVASAKSGATTMFVGCVGNDDFGRRLVANLDGAGADRSRVAIDPNIGSGVSVAIEQPDGSYGAVVVSGANQNICSPQFEDISARVLLIENEIPAAVNIEAARTLKFAGAYVVYNTAPYLPLSDDLLQYVDLIVANRVEATEATGIAIESLDDASRAAKMMSSRGCSAIVTAGELGCALWTREGEPRLIPAYKVKVISTHGAGDVFCGILASRIARGVDLKSAVTEANMIAAQFVSGITTHGMPEAAAESSAEME